MAATAVTRYREASQNLRSTSETELMEIYPSHVVVSWIGHSEKVARKHYLQTTDAYFERATTKPVAPQVRETMQTDKPIKAKNHENTNVFRGSADEFAYLQPNKLPRRDSNPD